VSDLFSKFRKKYKARAAHDAVDALEVLVMLDALEAAEFALGHARCEIGCDRVEALRQGRGLSQGGSGAPCNCGAKEAIRSATTKLARVHDLIGDDDE